MVSSISRRETYLSGSTITILVALVSLAVLCVLPCFAGQVPENFIVSTQDGVASIYDLSSYALVGSFKTLPLTYNAVCGTNNRSVFSVGGMQYVSVADTSIGKETTRVRNVYGPSATRTNDGKLLLVGDYNYSLVIVDAIQPKALRTVDLSSVLGIGTFRVGAIVPVGNKAYVFPRNSNADKVAVVDLATYAVSAIQIPVGQINKRGAAATPDGSVVVALESVNGDGFHVLLISTATNTIVGDVKQAKGYGVRAFVITPNGVDPSKIFGYIIGTNFVIALDLRANSQTYGQILANTYVPLSQFFGYSGALNSDGTRLIVSGTQSAQYPNVNILDTDKIITNPTSAVIAKIAAQNGVSSLAVCTGFFTTTPLGTAPSVTSVSGGNVTNDVDRQLTISGGNFQPDAMVRVGSMDPVPATFVNGGTLNVTVPANSPAGKSMDVIVTNPLTNNPPNMQNQSGVLSGTFNLLPNPKFIPTTQFATANTDNSFSVYDLSAKSMQNIQDNGRGNILRWPAFNIDGKQLYIPASNYSGDGALPVALANNSPGAFVPFQKGQERLINGPAFFARPDPVTGTPVVNMPTTDFNFNDVYVEVLDSSSASPTFNTIVRTMGTGVGYPNGVDLYAATVTPDGKYAYLLIPNFSGGDDQLGIMGLTPPGSFTSFPTGALGIDGYQYQISISPDGKSMLALKTDNAGRIRIRVFDISVPIRPKVVAEITPAAIPGYGYPYILFFQVVGNNLYAFDTSGYILVFNFDRKKGDFRQRGYTYWNSGWYAYAFSADGAYLYLPSSLYDEVDVLDTSKLASGNNVLITRIRAPYGPNYVDASPVPPPAKIPIRHVGN